jgi:hypothetical protein
VLAWLAACCVLDGALRNIWAPPYPYKYSPVQSMAVGPWLRATYLPPQNYGTWPRAGRTCAESSIISAPDSALNMPCAGGRASAPRRPGFLVGTHLDCVAGATRIASAAKRSTPAYNGLLLTWMMFDAQPTQTQSASV